jgi:recombination factor protein rarA
METSSDMVPAGSMVNAEKKGCELFPDLAFDAVLSYNPAATADDFSAFFSHIAQEHTAGARIIFAFPLPQQGLRLSALLPPDDAAEQSVNRFTAAETAFFSDSKNKRIAWTERTVAELAEKAGYRVQLLKKIDYQEKRLITQAELNRWFSAESEYGTAIRSAFAADKAELEKIIRQLEQRCRKPAAYTRTIVYMSVSREIM